MSGSFRHVLSAVVVVAVLIALRALVSGPEELEDLRRFEEASGLSVGPATSFFAKGIHGDGATFAIVAADPLGRDVGHLLHHPSYRYMRFGYPWLARGVALGQERLILLGLSSVGMMAAGAVAFMASRLNDLRGVSAWWLVANPALIVGAINDTAEPLAVCLLTLSILTGSTWAPLGLAAVRPTFLVGVTGRWRMFIFAVSVAVISKAYWSWHFEESALTGGFNVDWPLRGIFASPSLLGWIVMTAAVVTAAVGASKRDWSWMLSGIFVICFAQPVLDAPMNAVRASAFLPVLWAFGPNFESTVGLKSLFAPGIDLSRRPRVAPDPE
jgi:hypothetical protein